MPFVNTSPDPFTVIQINYCKIVDFLIAGHTSRVIDHLFAEQIIAGVDHEELNAIKDELKTEKARKVLKIVMNKCREQDQGLTVLKKFQEVLRQVGYTAAFMENTAAATDPNQECRKRAGGDHSYGNATPTKQARQDAVMQSDGNTTPTKQARQDAVSIDDLVRKRQTSGVLRVRVLHHVFARGQHSPHKRYIHLKVGDITGYLLIVAFEQLAEKMYNKLMKKPKPWSLEIIGELAMQSAQAGFKNFCPDGCLHLSQGTEDKLVDSPVQCRAPTVTPLSGLPALPTFSSCIAIREALVVKIRASERRHHFVEMALFDDSEEKCVLLSMKASDERFLLNQIPFSIEVKQAWVYVFGGRKQLRANEEDLAIIHGTSELNKKWEEVKGAVDPDEVFQIPYRYVKSITDIRTACKSMENGQYKYFKINATIKTTVKLTGPADLEEQTFLYLGCLDNKCTKTVDENANAFYCRKCSKKSTKPQWRYCLKVQLGDSDFQREEELIEQMEDLDLGVVDNGEDQPGDDAEATGADDQELFVTAFDGEADVLMNRTCPELAEQWGQPNGQANVIGRFTFLLDSQWRFGIQAKKDVKNTKYGPIILTLKDHPEFLGK